MKNLHNENFVFNEATIEGLQQIMQQGAQTSKLISTLYIDWIEAIDKSGPCLNSVIELNPDALIIADERDQERKAGKVRGPLHGIPILLKDNIDTGDKMLTSAGSLAMMDNHAADDAEIVKVLRKAGAVIIGKTNLSEWMNFRSTSSISGWSSRGGQTKNPYALDRNPSGSSSGSAAAVSANLCAAAIGTETDGSIVDPAACCGIVGIKPTVGLLSQKGIIPISETQDAAGPMTRSVRDAALLLDILRGNTDSSASYLSVLELSGLKGKRIGADKAHLQAGKLSADCYRKALNIIRKLGADVVEVEFTGAFDRFTGYETTILQHRFKYELNRYLAGAKTFIKSLEELMEYNRKHEDLIMPYFKQEIFEIAQKTEGLDSTEYLNALKGIENAKQAYSEIFEEHKLDAVSGISMELPFLTDPALADQTDGFFFSPPAAITGCPLVTVPMTMVNGLPLGISFAGAAYQESRLLAIAYAFEQSANARRTPALLKAINYD